MLTAGYYFCLGMLRNSSLAREKTNLLATSVRRRNKITVNSDEIRQESDKGGRDGEGSGNCHRFRRSV